MLTQEVIESVISGLIEGLGKLFGKRIVSSVLTMMERYRAIRQPSSSFRRFRLPARRARILYDLDKALIEADEEEFEIAIEVMQFLSELDVTELNSKLDLIRRL